MLSRTTIQHIHSLRSPKFRKLHNEFIAEGPKLVGDILSSSWAITGIYALKEWIQANESRLLDKKIPVFDIRQMELERISSMTTPNEVVATVEIPELKPFSFETSEDLVLILDKIQDPGNLGTIIRIADWFGFSTIICSEDTADVFNPKVVQASMGSLLRVILHYMDLEDFLKGLPAGRMIYGSMTGGNNLFNEDLKKNSFVIIGNESKGISPALLPYVRQKIGIPGSPDSIESLNASMAAAIICAEFRRRNPIR